MNIYKICVGLIPGIILTFSALGQVKGKVEFNDTQRKQIHTNLSAQFEDLDVNSVNWNMDKEGNYEGSFNYKERGIKTTYDNKGNWIGTSEDIDIMDLPKNVYINLTNDYSVEQIERTSRYINNESEIYYDVQIKGEEEPVRFDIEGNLLAEN